MPVSGPTVLRELRRAGCLPPPDPVVTGIDDWALARGHRYGTIVVDLDRHCPIKLLAGRDAPTVVSWLKEQPGIEFIARDRASAYADAARTAAPDAQQVADRWRLLTSAGQPARCRRAGAAALPDQRSQRRPARPARRSKLPRPRCSLGQTRRWRPPRQMSRLSKPDSAIATRVDKVGWPATRR